VETDCEGFSRARTKENCDVRRSNVPIGQSFDRSTEIKIVVKNRYAPRIESEIIFAPFHSLLFPTDQALCFIVKGFCNDILFAFRVTVTQNSRGHG